jgi:hypothetical protein
MTGDLGIRAIGAITTHRTVDESWINTLEGIVISMQAFHHSGAKALYQYIRLLHQPIKHIQPFVAP